MLFTVGDVDRVPLAIYLLKRETGASLIPIFNFHCVVDNDDNDNNDEAGSNSVGKERSVIERP